MHQQLRTAFGRQLLLVALLVCAATRIATADQPWPLGQLEPAGFDAQKLDRIVDDIRAGRFPNTHALLIEHDGKLVYERYFRGSDERWGIPVGRRQFGTDSLHDLRSVSKSVTSALLGIALTDGFDQAVNRPVGQFLPRLNLDSAADRITLHHVLTMTAGLEWNEMEVPYTSRNNDEIRLYAARDPALHVLTRPIKHAPGSHWYYCGGLTQVLASIVSERTGHRLDVYAREKLFAPLGIDNFEWLGPTTWGHENPAAMSGLRMTARDLAKIGSVYLHGGRWQGNQLVPEKWVELSMKRHVKEIGPWSRGGIWGYGYQWWSGELPGGETVVAGVGNGNQRLFIVPERQLVVTVLAGEYNRFEGHSDRLLRRVLTAQKRMD